MKDFQKRTYLKELKKANISDKKYLSYTKDSFYFKETTGMWCWKQLSKGIVHERKSKVALKKLKNEELIGKGNYDHSKTHDYQKIYEIKSGYLNTEEFAKITKLGHKNYVSMLLKRATTPIKEHDKRAEDKRKRGLHFIDCLKKANIEYLHANPKNIYKNIKLKQKIWVFKGVADVKIKKFNELWKTK
tara:strand:- start:26 stop:589 length:564 start_codon:yes stop_codon:yes gene_type:complete